MKTNLKRLNNAHKGDFGHLVVVAGSSQMIGAAYLTTMSALRTGVGKLTLASTAEVCDVLAPHVPEAMYLRLASKSGVITCASWAKLRSYCKKVDALAIGPGLGSSIDLSRLVGLCISELNIPIILDADGINAIQGKPSILQKAKKALVLTPHDGEFRRIIKRTGIDHRKSRQWVAKKITNQYDCILVRKGYRSLVVGRDGRIYVNKTGNPGLATSGSGDVLTGVIGSFIAQSFDPYFATMLGVYVHGAAGDASVARFGLAPILASDLIASIPQVIKKLERMNDLSKLFNGGE